MISRIVELEQKRYADKGIKTIVTPYSMTINSPLEVLNIANDTYILTGVVMSSTDKVSDNTLVSITSATDYVESTIRTIASMSAFYKIFKNSIVIKTYSREGYDANAIVLPYSLEFVKITPIL